jgi:exosortase/archaeosortase family protein
MPDDSPAPRPTDPPGRTDWLPGLLLGVVCIALFWPTLAWMGAYTAAHEQLKNALIITVAAVVACVWKQGARLRTAWSVSNMVVGLVAAAFGLVALAGYTSTPILVVAGLMCAIAGMVKFVWGESARPLLRPAIIGLAGFVLLMFVMPVLDWPLRTLAGTLAADLLITLGLAPELALVRDNAGAWQLVLSLGKNLFVVAPECNGFGLISSSLLLALILSQASDEPWLWRIVSLPVAVVIGFLFNVARILAITLLAQRFPGKQAYDLIHETAGTVALWSCLIAVWWLSGFRLGPRTRASEGAGTAKPG